jgi:hypothetical protein
MLKTDVVVMRREIHEHAMDMTLARGRLAYVNGVRCRGWQVGSLRILCISIHSWRTRLDKTLLSIQWMILTLLSFAAAEWTCGVAPHRISNDVVSIK